MLRFKVLMFFFTVCIALNTYVIRIPGHYYELVVFFVGIGFLLFGMKDLLYSIYLAIFNFINQGLSNPFFDWLMPLFDNVKDWIPAILIMWLLLCYFD